MEYLIEHVLRILTKPFLPEWIKEHFTTILLGVMLVIRFCRWLVSRKKPAEQNNKQTETDFTSKMPEPLRKFFLSQITYYFVFAGSLLFLILVIRSLWPDVIAAKMITEDDPRMLGLVIGFSLVISLFARQRATALNDSSKCGNCGKDIYKGNRWYDEKQEMWKCDSCLGEEVLALKIVFYILLAITLSAVFIISGLAFADMSKGKFTWDSFKILAMTAGPPLIIAVPCWIGIRNGKKRILMAKQGMEE